MESTQWLMGVLAGLCRVWTAGVRAQGTGPQISASRAQLRGNPRSHEQAMLVTLLIFVASAAGFWL